MPGPHRIRYVADAFRAGLDARGRAAQLPHRSVVPRADRGSRARRARGRSGRASRRSMRPRCARSSARVSPTAASRRSLGVRRGRACASAATRSACAPSSSASTPARPSSRPRPRTCIRPTRRSAKRRRPIARKIMILGGGPNRIGQGIEFDYCCVHAALALREDGFETIMVNCNPETVSTDYDTSDRLYFEPLTFEDVHRDHRTSRSRSA